MSVCVHRKCDRQYKLCSSLFVWGGGYLHASTDKVYGSFMGTGIHEGFKRG